MLDNDDDHIVIYLDFSVSSLMNKYIILPTPIYRFDIFTNILFQQLANNHKCIFTCAHCLFVWNVPECVIYDYQYLAT